MSLHQPSLGNIENGANFRTAPNNLIYSFLDGPVRAGAGFATVSG